MGVLLIVAVPFMLVAMYAIWQTKGAMAECPAELSVFWLP